MSVLTKNPARPVERVDCSQQAELNVHMVNNAVTQVADYYMIITWFLQI